ncbi:Phox homologous domain [Plasmopara halstedii]|uniref:Phox homologous domain n=1 Tax=Plasmopara halstedii TaxID=4781 RepID=A0A0P1AUL8_PLAHL|nr:Phox homologous domain [Plasmopara halstedii]CEG45125.1 Phox homologous domain [Plasmopara halstedii]|eukprot:XP_024581494.1 Phox homologous domain [Plasmopara halstedii]
MGCNQSKTNEHDVNVSSTAQLSISKSEVFEKNVTTNGVQPSIAPSEAESEPALTANEAVVKTKIQDFALQFHPGEVCINEYGVAFYNFDGSNPADPSQEFHVSKRYSEFKIMHAAISKLMASEKNVKVKDQDKFQTYPALPSMPRANAVTYLLGRGDQNVVKEREDQFVKILNAIAAHPIAFKSETFKDFLT